MRDRLSTVRWPRASNAIGERRGRTMCLEGGRKESDAEPRLPVAVILPEQPRDATAIYSVHAQSFPTDLEARLVDLLRAAGRLSVSLAAHVDDAIVGHVAFSPVTADGAATKFPGAGLAPVAVLEPYR